jgi:hypothetical protein
VAQGYTDLEMVREMSAAPDWMVRHMLTARSRCSPQEIAGRLQSQDPTISLLNS